MTWKTQSPRVKGGGLGGRRDQGDLSSSRDIPFASRGVRTSGEVRGETDPSEAEAGLSSPPSSPEPLFVGEAVEGSVFICVRPRANGRVGLSSSFPDVRCSRGLGVSSTPCHGQYGKRKRLGFAGRRTPVTVWNLGLKCRHGGMKRKRRLPSALWSPYSPWGSECTTTGIETPWALLP